MCAFLLLQPMSASLVPGSSGSINTNTNNNKIRDSLSKIHKTGNASSFTPPLLTVEVDAKKNSKHKIFIFSNSCLL